MFTCSGTEANELALRIARFATGNGGTRVATSATTRKLRHLSRSLTTCFPVVEQFPGICAQGDGARPPLATLSG